MMKLKETKKILKRRAAILAVPNKGGTYFAIIEKYLKTKFSMEAVKIDQLLQIKNKS